VLIRLNNNRYKCPPWGIPDFTLNIVDETSNKLTNCHLSVRYEWNHDKRGSWSPLLNLLRIWIMTYICNYQLNSLSHQKRYWRRKSKHCSFVPTTLSWRHMHKKNTQRCKINSFLHSESEIELTYNILCFYEKINVNVINIIYIIMNIKKKINTICTSNCL